MLFVAFGALVLVPLLSGSAPYSKATAMAVAFIALATTVLVSLVAKGIVKRIPILVGIAVVGLNTLVQAREDITAPRPLSIIALILVSGIGGLAIKFGNFELSGIGLAGVLGVLLNVVLPRPKD